MEQGQGSVGILVDAHARLDPVMAQWTVGQLQPELAPGHGVVALGRRRVTPADGRRSATCRTACGNYG